jgi:hypothetical protein
MPLGDRKKSYANPAFKPSELDVHLPVPNPNLRPLAWQQNCAATARRRGIHWPVERTVLRTMAALPPVADHYRLLRLLRMCGLDPLADLLIRETALELAVYPIVIRPTTA